MAHNHTEISATLSAREEQTQKAKGPQKACLVCCLSPLLIPMSHAFSALIFMSISVCSCYCVFFFLGLFNSTFLGVFFSGSFLGFIFVFQFEDSLHFHLVS